MLAIAQITILETVRRRVVAIIGIASLGLIAAIGWGFFKLSTAIPDARAAIAVEAVLTILVSFAFSVVLAIGASFLAAPAIAGEIESGTALAILPRPIRRSSYVLGKWLGLAAIVVGYALLCGALAFAAIGAGCGYRAPDEPAALLYLAAQSLVLFTLSLALSTRLSPIAGGIVSVALFGVGWVAGITASVATSLQATALANAAALTGLFIPSDGLWRGAIYHLTPVAMLAAEEHLPRGAINPFAAAAPPGGGFLAWTTFWIVAALTFAVTSLNRRDI